MVTRQPWWWTLIHAVFAPLAWAVAALSIDPGWFLLAFMLMLLVYRGAIAGQIPLYLSNTATAAAIAAITVERSGMRLVDLGPASVACCDRWPERAQMLCSPVSKTLRPRGWPVIFRPLAWPTAGGAGAIFGMPISRNTMWFMRSFPRLPCQRYGKRLCAKCAQGACSSATVLLHRELNPVALSK